jgi:hypothetical protein
VAEVTAVLAEEGHGADVLPAEMEGMAGGTADVDDRLVEGASLTGSEVDELVGRMLCHDDPSG